MAARRLLVVLVLAAACTGETSPPATSPVPASSAEASEPASFGPAAEALIAFHSDPAGRDDTYVMTPDGREGPRGGGGGGGGSRSRSPAAWRRSPSPTGRRTAHASSSSAAPPRTDACSCSTDPGQSPSSLRPTSPARRRRSGLPTVRG